LTWRVSQEFNCDGYQIEKSEDGITFVSIGFIKCQALGGNSSSGMDYVFSDDAANKNNLYYRLKINDMDGRFQYSKVVYVPFGKVSNGISNIYPNPASGSLSIIVNANTSGIAKIEIINFQGQRCMSFDRFLFSGNNNIFMGLSNLSTGNYYARITFKDGGIAGSNFIKK